MSSPQTTRQVFEQCFLEVRAKLIEIAASLDRIERANTSESIDGDPRLYQIRKSIEILNSRGFDRVERIQMVFSDDYEPNWNQYNC